MGPRYLLPFIVFSAACSGPAPTAPSSRPVTLRVKSAGPASAPVRAVTPQSSSPLALVDDGAHRYALVADADENALVALEAATGRIAALTPLQGRPGHLLPLSDGRLAVTLRDRNEVVIFAAHPTGLSQPLRIVSRHPVGVDPWGLAEDGRRRLWVTNTWSATVDRIDLNSESRPPSVEVAAEPRGIVIEAGRAVITHAVGAALTTIAVEGEAAPTVVDTAIGSLDDGEPTSFASLIKRPDPSTAPAKKAPPRPANQGFVLAAMHLDERPFVFAPRTHVDSGSLSKEIVSGGYGSASITFAETVGPYTGLVHLGPTPQSVTADAVRATLPPDACTLPRSVTTWGERLFVGCAGIDRVLEVDPRHAEPFHAEKRRFVAPSGPVGLAVDPDAGRLLAFGAFDHRVVALDLEAGNEVWHTDLYRRAVHDTELAEQERRGRRLFHATRDPRLSGDQRACASCHPDGRNDSLVWSSPDGRRQTKMLAGRLRDSAPYGWFGEHETLAEHLRDTVRRLGGRGFVLDGDARDLADLVAYIRSLPGPTLPKPKASALATRGHAIFTSAEQGCDNCHEAGTTNGRRYDIASGVRGERSQEFDVPSLRYIAGSAPYFHDGRFASLRDMLLATSGDMGHAADLSPGDLDALEAYLATL